MKNECFRASREHFKAALAELNRMGVGGVVHFWSIDEVDRRKLYTSIHLLPVTPFEFKIQSIPYLLVFLIDRERKICHK